MSYLQEFRNQIDRKDFHKFFQLWEEYCTNEDVDVKEFFELTELIKESEFAVLFGRFAETALLIWEGIEDEDYSYKIMRNLIDMQTTNSEVLAEKTRDLLEKRYSGDPHFKEKIKKIGLRRGKNFQGAISNYELLRHLGREKFVFHKGGWGVGEIMDVSFLREQIAVEFENVARIKYFTLDNAFKVLRPLPDDHFLARRFGHPDLFEEFAKEDPVGAIKILLRDLGPMNAKGIKEEFYDLIIPSSDWSRWWQNARSKLKKDPMIEYPESLRDPFKIRTEEVTHDEALAAMLNKKEDVGEIIRAAYSFVKDSPHLLQKEEVKNSLKEKLLEIFSRARLPAFLELQLRIFLKMFFNHKINGKSTGDFIKEVDNIEEAVSGMDIVAFRKKALATIREYRSYWIKIFLNLLFAENHNSIRDYILKELCGNEEAFSALTERLRDLIIRPENCPDFFFWYFQKIVKGKNLALPFSDKEGKCKLLDAFLVLLHKIEFKREFRDLVKKMRNFLTGKRFLAVRELIKDTEIDFLKEFLLLVSKCHTFSDHEKSIMRSLVAVVQPALASKKKNSSNNMRDSEVIWTTREGYLKTADRIKQIATSEMIENAKEVEEARALGDLRENAEYKSACEKRARLQGEMKMLSRSLNRARILTEEDIYPGVVGIGSVVELENRKGERITYTILGPWDADVEKNIISYQSRLAQAMADKRVGNEFRFLDDKYKVVAIKSYLG